MDYCKVGEDSDVYVIATDDGQFSCVGCSRGNGGPFKTHREIYNHLVDHHFAKDKVPEAVMHQLLADRRAQVEKIRSSMTPEEAQGMLDQLSLYYGEPVKPINLYCNAFRTWKRAVEDGAHNSEEGSAAKRSLESMAKAIGEVSLMVSKSNLLARLLYDGEELRTEPCPIHKGQWSGCVWGDRRCPHCMSGDNVTGWVDPKTKGPQPV